MYPSQWGKCLLFSVVWISRHRSTMLLQSHVHCICPNSKCATDAMILHAGKSVYASAQLLTDPNKIVLFPDDELY
jgi:hypothetical protein